MHRQLQAVPPAVREARPLLIALLLPGGGQVTSVTVGGFRLPEFTLQKRPYGLKSVDSGERLP